MILGTPEIVKLPKLVAALSAEDKKTMQEILAKQDIADESFAIQELDYYFIKKLRKDYPQFSELETIFAELDKKYEAKNFDGFNSPLEDEAVIGRPFPNQHRYSGYATGGDIKDYPSKKWLIGQLRNNLYSRVNYPVLDMMIVGSEARGTAKENSDIDIAVIIPESKRISAIKRTENYHSRFSSESQKPIWNGRVIDFQFFYPTDAELNGYDKIKLEDGGGLDYDKLSASLQTVNSGYERNAAEDVLDWLKAGKNPNDEATTEIVIGVMRNRIKELQSVMDEWENSSANDPFRTDDLVLVLVDEYKTFTQILELYETSQTSRTSRTGEVGEVLKAKLPRELNYFIENIIPPPADNISEQDVIKAIQPKIANKESFLFREMEIKGQQYGRAKNNYKAQFKNRVWVVFEENTEEEDGLAQAMGREQPKYFDEPVFKTQSEKELIDFVTGKMVKETAPIFSTMTVFQVHEWWNKQNDDPELDKLEQELVKVKGNKAARTKVAQQISEIRGRIEADFQEKWTEFVAYLRKYTVDSGLMEESALDKVFETATIELSDYIFERGYIESTWKDSVMSLWFEILDNDRESALAHADDPNYPSLTLVGVIKKHYHHAEHIASGFLTDLPEDILPAWGCVFENLQLSQAEIIATFDCRVKVFVKAGKTYFILPYKFTPGEAEPARLQFNCVANSLVELWQFDHNQKESEDYVEKLKWLNNQLKTPKFEQIEIDQLLNIDATSYTREQLLAFFRSQPNEASFKARRATGYQNIQTVQLVNDHGTYRMKDKEFTVEQLVDDIEAEKLIVLTQKSPSRIEPIVEVQEPEPIPFEFSKNSEFGETVCATHDIKQVIAMGWCPCADGTDHRFTANEMRQLQEIEDSDTEKFVLDEKLKHPLNWIAKMKADGNKLLLPIERMTAKEYADVKNVMQKSGGRYQKNAFVFEEPATDVYMRILGGEDYNLKKKFQYFPTPDATANMMVRLADIKCGMTFLEPSAGRGSIIKAIHRVCPDAVVDYYEIMETNRKYLQEIPNTVERGVMFEDKARLKYDRIIANPPFSNNQDENHIQLMYELLNPGGKLVSVSSTHWQFAAEKQSSNFRNWIKTVNAEIIEVPAGTFKESGTMVPSLIIVISKPKND